MLPDFDRPLSNESKIYYYVSIKLLEI